MCGIHGIWQPGQDPAQARAALGRMAAVSRHRGPDDLGDHVDGPAAIGMVRLSIIDLAGGHQPIANEDGTVTAVCNGEIYNFQRLRSELQARGHTFSTGSDTEVLVHLYEEHGDGLVEHLEGMYAFAIWDQPRQRLLLARDRLGIKPLYIAGDGQRLLFASELKSVLAVQDSTPQLDRTALAEYLALGYVPAPLSLVAGTRKLPPGTLLVCDGSGVREQRYWRPEAAQEQLSGEEWVERTEATVRDAVQAQMVSDVPIGAFLSGGVDSSLVVAAMAEGGADVSTYAIGFDGGAADRFYNELPYARQVAEHFGTNHHEILVRPDVAALLPKLLWHLDEPVADSAFVTTWLVSEFAARDVKVILSGVGGDELFGGYRRYLGEHYMQALGRLPRWLRRQVLQPIARQLPADRHSGVLNFLRYARAMLLAQDLSDVERYRSFVGVFSAPALDGVLLEPLTGDHDALASAFADVAAGPAVDAVEQLMRVDLLTQMPDDLLALTDRTSMAASLECRVPLLDERLLELAFAMPGDVKIRGRDLKHVLKQVALRKVPEGVVNRPKRGFGAPMGAWLRDSLAGMTGDLLGRDAVAARGLFDPAAIERLIADHDANRADHTDHIQGLVNLEIWCRVVLDGASPEAVAGDLERPGRAAA